ncbi:MAG TPA: hypothetical protein VG347_04185 [Verrucomicrobiae bacterium]|nr:hypothetical protein [Verrucomicrobiae bacterium]
MKTIWAVLGICILSTLATRADDCADLRQQNDTLRKELKDDAALVADLRQQITNAVATETLSGATNAELYARIDTLTQERDEARGIAEKLAPQAAKAMKLPVTVTWRKALTGRGSVLQIHNTTGTDLPAVVECSNDTFGTKRYRVIIPGIGNGGAQWYELGVSQGWDFLSGDTAKITSAGFTPGTVTCP